jgi:hypothetical protein
VHHSQVCHSFPPILSFWGTKWRRISAPQCIITPTFADSSGLNHIFSKFYHLSVCPSEWHDQCAPVMSFWGACPDPSGKNLRTPMHKPQPIILPPDPVILRNEVTKNLRTPMHKSQPNLSSLPLSVILNPKTLWQCYNSQIALYLLFVVIRGEESPNLSAPLPSLSFIPPYPVILRNEVTKNLRTPMHNHSDLRRFFGTQPYFLKVLPFKRLSLRMTWPVRPLYLSFWARHERRIFESQCTITSTFADSSEHNHLWNATPSVRLFLRMTAIVSHDQQNLPRLHNE